MQPSLSRMHHFTHRLPRYFLYSTVIAGLSWPGSRVLLDRISRSFSVFPWKRKPQWWYCVHHQHCSEIGAFVNELCFTIIQYMHIIRMFVIYVFVKKKISSRCFESFYADVRKSYPKKFANQIDISFTTPDKQAQFFVAKKCLEVIRQIYRRTTRYLKTFSASLLWVIASTN